MAGHPLLPNPSCLVLESIGVQNGAIALAARTATAGATCPCCGWLSERVHSHYPRTLLDLPWQGNAVHVVLSVRKFFCDNPDCERRVFAERLPAVAARYARKTCRLADALRELAYLAGGEAAARIARTFGLLVSPDALLESLRRSSLPAPASPTPRVLGVDDFAFKRGRRYGTLLVDLERRCPVDLLLDRESTTVERWLKEHPGVEIVSRDRANCYAEGVRAGAPHAVQVADRWHLIKNVGDALEKVLIRKHSLLREVAARSGDAPQLQPAPPSPRRVRQSQQANARHERRLARYEQILDLHRKGVSILGIQRLTGADPKTIRKYLRNGGLPERQPRCCCAQSGKLTAFEEHLEQRWSEGCHNAAHLLAEIRALGYRGGYTAVRDFLQPLRARAALPPLTVSPTAKRFASPPSPRRLAWLVTNRSHPCARAQDMAFLDALASTCTEVKQAMEAAQSLCAIIRERRAVEELDTWLTATQQSGVAEIKALASSLQMDRVAVAAALSLPWSNGQVEGQVNRLKFLKRSMYGSAGYDLLRARVLPFQAATVIMARPA